MNDHDLRLQTVCDILAVRDITASVEYPGYILIETPHGNLAFGDANGPLAWDLTSPDGECLGSGESDLTVLQTWPMALADYVERVTWEVAL